jgi:hypothetical protein
LDSLIEQLPEIIKAASTSNLGIVALMLILFSVLSWGFFRRSSEIWKLSSLVILLAGCVLFGFVAIDKSKEVAASGDANSNSLKVSLTDWVAKAGIASKAGTISSKSPLPSDLVNTRNEFERLWRNSSLAKKKDIEPRLAFEGLSHANRLYRVVELDSSSKTNAIYWADESIRFFEEIQDSYYLTEALIDKAAIYLEIAQLGHNDKQQFEEMAREGDTVMTRAFGLANDQQKGTVLRISSRFYYILARPASFRLSDDWDNNYLLLSYQKASEAFEIDAGEIKNANQLARATIKVSKNPPQDTGPLWIAKLKFAEDNLRRLWLKNKGTRTSLMGRLSPLNVLGVVTLERVSREWQGFDSDVRLIKARSYKEALDSDSIAPLREAVALLNNSQLRKSYGFDIMMLPGLSRSKLMLFVISRKFNLQQSFPRLRRT